MLSKRTGSNVIHVSTSHLYQVTMCENVHVEEQNLPPQNTSLACVLYWAEKNEGPKDSGRNFDLPFNCFKSLHKRPFPRIELSPEIASKNMG